MATSINKEKRARDVIVIGASAGGIQATMTLLSRLPSDLAASIGVVIHRGAASTADWSEVLGLKTRLRVRQPADGEALERGVVYVAPPDCHLTFDRERVHLDHGPKQQYTRPAVDPLFSSAARAFGPRVAGVVLTGGGHDGLQGLLDIKARGGLTFAQSPSEAEHASMPENAITGDHVDAVLAVADLGDALVQLVHGEVVTLL